MPLSHISLPVEQDRMREIRDFYVNLLKPLGYELFKEELPLFVGFGPGTAPDFWLHCVGKEGGSEAGKMHVAFEGRSEGEVRAWYENALKCGAKCNGKPGERSYVKGYYAAFVLDPLGNNIEVVHWNPWWLQMLKAMPYVASGVGAVGVAFAAKMYLG